MLYTAHGKDFKSHVHPTLQRRLRMFFIIAAIALALVIYDVYQGTLGIGIALISVALGSVVGLITSRIYHLSWKNDGALVVGQIDTIGWVILVLYIGFEVLRNFFFSDFLHMASSATAITYAFVASALISRVFGLRGRMIKILRRERVFE